MATSVKPSDAQTWDEVEEKERGEFPVFPAGVYDAYFLDWGKKRTQDGKKEYYRPEFVVKGNGDVDGQEIHTWGYWENTPEQRGVMKKDLVSLGATAQDFAGVDVNDHAAVEGIINSVKGNDCRLRLTIRNYKGQDDEGNEVTKEQNNIKAVIPA